MPPPPTWTLEQPLKACTSFCQGTSKKRPQTHHEREKGRLLGFLRILLVLVQVVVELQRQRVIVASHYIQHLERLGSKDPHI